MDGQLVYQTLAAGIDGRSQDEAKFGSAPTLSSAAHILLTHSGAGRLAHRGGAERAPRYYKD
jgi:hypothetical protein